MRRLVEFLRMQSIGACAPQGTQQGRPFAAQSDCLNEDRGFPHLPKAGRYGAPGSFTDTRMTGLLKKNEASR